MRNTRDVIVLMLIGATAAFLSTCSSVRHVRPIDKGELAVTASCGGPLAGQIGWAPLPLFSAGANYGVAGRFDVEAIRTFCAGNAGTAFPALFSDNHTVEWGSK